MGARQKVFQWALFVFVLSGLTAVLAAAPDDPKPAADPTTAASAAPAATTGTGGAGDPGASGATGAATKPAKPPRPMSRGGRPTLVMDDRTEEPPEATDETAPPDPRKAKENMRIGNFYFHRGNFDAAAARFKEAVRNKPEWVEARRRHLDALEKSGNWAAVEEAARRYLADAKDAVDRKYFQGEADKAAATLKTAPPTDPAKPREPVKNPPTLW